jgi:hypothetical protein
LVVSGVLRGADQAFAGGVSRRRCAPAAAQNAVITGIMLGSKPTPISPRTTPMPARLYVKTKGIRIIPVSPFHAMNAPRSPIPTKSRPSSNTRPPSIHPINAMLAPGWGLMEATKKLPARTSHMRQIRAVRTTDTITTDGGRSGRVVGVVDMPLRLGSPFRCR